MKETACLISPIDSGTFILQNKETAKQQNNYSHCPFDQYLPRVLNNTALWVHVAEPWVDHLSSKQHAILYSKPVPGGGVEVSRFQRLGATSREWQRKIAYLETKGLFPSFRSSCLQSKSVRCACRKTAGCCGSWSSLPALCWWVWWWEWWRGDRTPEHPVLSAWNIHALGVYFCGYWPNLAFW